MIFQAIVKVIYKIWQEYETQKSVSFLSTKQKQPAFETIREKPSIILSQKNYLSVSFTKFIQDTYAQNYKTVMKIWIKLICG